MKRLILKDIVYVCIYMFLYVHGGMITDTDVQLLEHKKIIVRKLTAKYT